MSLPKHLWEIKERIRLEAEDRYGLDFFETVFEVVDYKKINELAAYGGFPTRYPHWRFGMDYERLSKSSEYGLSKIYEMVINNDPAYAYLLEGNNLVDQKTVIAHVYAHVDFFKNNFFFSRTNRRMIDEMANHAARVRRYIDRHGIEAVESFIDTCLSLDNLIDYFAPFIERQADPAPEDTAPAGPDDVPRFEAKDYMESYINPESFLDAQRAQIAEEAAKAERFPRQPERDVMQFLLEHAPLKAWEADILSLIREEAYYFAPQGQTKIMNEGWACVDGETLVFTDAGVMPMRALVDEDRAWTVSDGAVLREVYDSHVIDDHDTVTIRTRRGLVLTGSDNHRIEDGGGFWRRLDEFEVGGEVAVRGGAELWATDYVALAYRGRTRVSLEDVARRTGVSLSTVMRHRAGRTVRAAARVGAELAHCEVANDALNQSHTKRAPIEIPERLDEEFGAFLGYLVGDGHISRVKRHLGLTSGDLEPIERFCAIGRGLFGVMPIVKKDEGRWRALFHSEELSDFLTAELGLTSGPSAAEKKVPDAILRSPRAVVAAFLSALFDADGYAGQQGVILSSKSEALSRQVQLLLLNFGCLSRRRIQRGGCWHVHVAGASAARWATEIGFGLERKRAALASYVDDRKGFKEERWSDEIISIERGRGRVYDISVRETHKYAAGGFVNHNSFWHSRILTNGILDDSEIIDFADINAGVLQTAPGQLNPYKLGVELFRDIEERWNTGRFGKEWEDASALGERASWDRQTGRGGEKIFEVRKLYNDITFIDEFLTEDFARRNKMFSYAFNKKAGRWEIESREFATIKARLLDQLTNFGQPFIAVVDGNYKNRAELLLHHTWEGTELRVDYARGVLEALWRVWRRPVNLRTVVDEKGAVLTYDGSSHSETATEYEGI